MLQRGAVYSSRPVQNNFRTSNWPWRLVIMPTGANFRFLRKIYSNILAPKQTIKLRKYQDFESKMLISEFLVNPNAFVIGIERFSLSVIFSACYGVRLTELNHPLMVEFFSIWTEMLRCKSCDLSNEIMKRD